MRTYALATILLAACGGSHAVTTPPPGPGVNGTESISTGKADVEFVGHVFKPDKLPPPDLAALHVPAGFAITRVAEDLGNVRMIAMAPNGTIYYTRRDEADVMMTRLEGDHVAPPVRVASRAGVHGIALHAGKLYLATPHEIFRGDVHADGSLGELTMLIHDLPDAGQHNTRTVQIGPDDMMYIGVGSTCNECNEPNPEAATMLRASLDGTSRAIFASGLRDPVGWGWQPETGELWSMDHGIDWLGDERQQEELNHVEAGKRYGWPYVFGTHNEMNPQVDPPGKLTKEEWQAIAVPAVLGYAAHAAPMQLAFYGATQFPADYRGDAFVAMHGSWNRKTPTGYEIVRVDFEHGEAKTITPFVTGFLTPAGESGRPCGVAVLADGSLLFSDDRTGALYRVAYTGPAEPGTPLVAPASPMQAAAAKGSGVPIAILREETTPAKSNPLTIRSAAFADGAAIPEAHSAYEQDASMPLTWSDGPQTTRSFVIIMEDPDRTRPPMPVIHWVAWNIPPTTHALREGLAKQDLLQDPAGMRQGPGSNGKTGYNGPRPPAGEPPHHYHVQLFALDVMLALPAGADRDAVLDAMKGHVLARGELVGTFQRPTAPSKP